MTMTPKTEPKRQYTVLKESLNKKIEYSIKFSNRITNENYISNHKGEIVFRIHFWVLYIVILSNLKGKKCNLPYLLCVIIFGE